MEEIPLSEEPPQLRVGIAYNLKKSVVSDVPDNEAEYDEFSTILAIRSALEKSRCRVELLEATQDLPSRLAGHPVDIVFNIAEGIQGRGREAQVPALLNFFQIPFTGSDETTLCIALDKALTKRILTSYHIKTPKYTIIRRDAQPAGVDIPYPAIIKPNAEGSSKGINNFSIITNRNELRQLLTRNLDLYKQDMLVEEYIEGREFTVGILGNGKDARVFPPMEILYKNRQNRFNIYSYEVKQDYKTYVQYQCPADISADTQDEIVNTAKKIYDILGCRDCARVDFRLSPEGCLHFIEINPLPGLAPGYSDFPMIAEFNGMDYGSLIWNVLKAALKRYGMNSYL
jgi:D-alanine-D-alanine ligase